MTHVLPTGPETDALKAKLETSCGAQLAAGIKDAKEVARRAHLRAAVAALRGPGDARPALGLLVEAGWKVGG